MLFLHKFLKQMPLDKPILTANKLINWKKNKGVYNFTKLPTTVILTPNTNYVSGIKKIMLKKAKGLSGKNYILNSNFLLSTNYGIGAPALVNHIEELAALGVKQFVFIGFAGIIQDDIESNNGFLVSTSFSLNGITNFYAKSNLIEYKNPLTDKIKKLANLKEVSSISTDAIFRETTSLIEKYKQKKVSLIDMESASFLAVTKFYDLPSACVLVAADKLKNEKWIPPNDMLNLNQTMDDLITELKIKL